MTRGQSGDGASSEAPSSILKAAIYARVSTQDQNCEMQVRELREYAGRRGWQIVGDYIDTEWSGAKASRPELDAS
jgi:DNA invertase Pin-like site-specific DNA recombinase